MFCHIPELFGDEETADGDIGGVEVGGNSKDDEVGGSSKADEPRVNGLSVAMSTAEAERDLGEGMAEPVEAYKGRNSSGLWAKKQTFLLHPVSSLQSRVRYLSLIHI